jgi:hypothetical protein
MKKNLKRFSELDKYKVRRKNHDVNDWLVRGEDNHIIGFVNDMIVDLELKKVIFLEVSLADGYHKTKGNPLYILIPLERVDLDAETEEVLAPITQHSVEIYPNYDGRIITPSYLFKLQSHYDVIDSGDYNKSERKEERSWENLNRNKEFQDNLKEREHNSDNNDPLAQYELAELKVQYLELKKELKKVQADREIAILERDIALAQMRKEKLETGIDKKHQFNFEHK